MSFSLAPHRLRLALLAWALAAGAWAQTSDLESVRQLLGRGEAQAALARVEAALAAPDVGAARAELRFLQAVALMDLGRDAQALAAFEALAQDHPELPDPWNNIALLQVRAGRLDDARRSLEAALRNDPSYRLARSNLGLVHLMLAVRAWEQLAASGPMDAASTRRLEGARALLAPAGR